MISHYLFTFAFISGYGKKSLSGRCLKKNDIIGVVQPLFFKDLYNDWELSMVEDFLKVQVDL